MPIKKSAMKLGNIKHRIISILLAMAIFSFNLAIPVARAGKSCNCDHPHGDGEFICFCSNPLKSSFESRVPSFKSRHCGLDDGNHSLVIPASKYPSILANAAVIPDPRASTLISAEIKNISGIQPPPFERPPRA